MNTLNILIIVICTVVGFHYIWKIVDRFFSTRRFKDEKSNFISDLYKLQQKWAKNGCYDYSEAVGLIIKSFNLPEELPQPKTSEGKRLLKRIEEEQAEEDEQ